MEDACQSRMNASETAERVLLRLHQSGQSIIESHLMKHHQMLATHMQEALHKKAALYTHMQAALH
eukprot:1150328-Pelagomonas_calceolata.AAC.6